MKTENLRTNDKVKDFSIQFRNFHVDENDIFHTPFHIHDELEILYVYDKHLLCRTGDSVELILNPGDIAIFNCDTPHDTCSVIGTKYFMIQIPVESHMQQKDLYLFQLKKLLNNEYVIYKSDSRESRELKDYIEKLFYYSETQNDNSDYIKGYAHLIMAFLKKTGIISPIKSYDTNRLNKILPAIEYINNNFQDKISIDSIGLENKFNPNYLERIFKQIIGITITEYINLVRINESKMLLINSDKKIEEISDMCGFASTDYFCRIFKKLNNQLTPSSFRKLKKA